jgi:bifunctional UDP-N-acetylglucosamine pyrophosphorylase/glucosamine-1-phosphate N-acetyltransferase
MRAVILAAGKGTRLEPLTEGTPKVMLPLAGKPILEYILEAAKEAGITDVTLVVGYREEDIRDYFGNGSKFELKIGYITQKKRLGTAHAVAQARSGEDFIVMNGDALVSSKIIEKVISAHEGAATLALKRVKNPEDYGVVRLEGERVEEIVEKPREFVSDLACIGVNAFSPRIFEAIERTEKSERGEYELTSSIEILIKEGEFVKGVEVQGKWLDIGNPWSYLDANQDVLKNLKPGIEGKVEEDVSIEGNLTLGEGSVVKSGTYIEGPVYIGKNSSIGPNTYLRAFATIGDNCHIGAGVEVKNSIIMDGTNVPHLSYVGDSIIGRACNLGAGTLVGNLRLDSKNVKMRIKGRLTDSRRRKFGCVIGDNTKLGLNVMINAGRKIGCNCMIGPGVIVYSDVPDNSFIVQKQELVEK